MDTIAQIDMQEAIERRFNKKHIDGYIRDFLTTDQAMQTKLDQGVQLVNDYMAKDYYASKNRRISQLHGMDIHNLVVDIFVGIAYCQKEELFTSVSAKMASRLKFSDKLAAITTVAELMAVLCGTDAFDIEKANRSASLMVVSRIPLSEDLIRFIENSAYLPPMVCEPRQLENNYSSGYLTHNDSLILGSGNHHDGDLCLDVLNKINKVQLKLATDFLCKVEEEPTFELDTREKMDQWMSFKRQSYEFYLLIAKNSDKFYLTHKVDKRGRIYASGYTISTQGSAFKKACVELAHEELVTGVP